MPPSPRLRCREELARHDPLPGSNHSRASWRSAAVLPGIRVLRGSRMTAMGNPTPWPSEEEISKMRKAVGEVSGKDGREVRIVVSPYRICPLGAHIDHQGGIVSAMTINKGILLAFVPSDDSQVFLQSMQFGGEVKFSVDEEQYPLGTSTFQGNNLLEVKQQPDWGVYARGALYALRRDGYNIRKGIIGFICGSEGLDSSGLSSSAAVGIAYLLALEYANELTISHSGNIELDRLIENEYLGLRNGILDQSAILLSKCGYLTCMNCKTKEHECIPSPGLEANHHDLAKGYKILLAFSGLKRGLIKSYGYNNRVAECQEAARILLHACGDEGCKPLLCNVSHDAYSTYKGKLEANLAKRAEHYFSENARVAEGLQAWASGNLEQFGRLISASGLSSIKNYECGCEPLIQLYKILLKAPGVLGARFSGAGFRGCCLSFVWADCAEEAADFVRREYKLAQPNLAGQLEEDQAVLVCEAGDSARII